MYASEKQMQYNTVDEEKQKDIYKHEVQEKGLAHFTSIHRVIHEKRKAGAVKQGCLCLFYILESLAFRM